MIIKLKGIKSAVGDCSLARTIICPDKSPDSSSSGFVCGGPSYEKKKRISFQIIFSRICSVCYKGNAI